MSNTKIKNAILTVIATFIAVSMAIITVSYVAAPGTTADGGTANGWAFFRYYTSDSNILVAILSIFVAVYALRNTLQNQDEMPEWLIIFYLVATTGTTVTFLTTAVFLTPLYTSYGYPFYFLFAGKMFFLHFLNPVLAIVILIFFLGKIKFNIKHVLLSISTVVVYSCVYVPMVLSKAWEDFYGFTFGGKNWVTPLSLIVMYSVTFGLAFLLAFLHNLFYKKMEERKSKS